MDFSLTRKIGRMLLVYRERERMELKFAPEVIFGVKKGNVKFRVDYGFVVR